MNRKRYRSILRQARAEGYCIAHIVIVLNVLSLEYVDTYEQETKGKFFQFIRRFLPEITWEEYWDSVNGPMKGFTVAQRMLPKLTWEMYKEISELKKEGGSAFTYIDNHREVFEDSPLWERANEQFTELENGATVPAVRIKHGAEALLKRDTFWQKNIWNCQI